MLGIETVPAVLYFFALMTVPESPRWLAMHGRQAEAQRVFEVVADPEQAAADLAAVQASLKAESNQPRATFRHLFKPTMKLVLTIGIGVAVLQQITGINAVFFYAPMIFEQTGIGTDAAFMQAILVGIVNLVFTILAIALIDRLGRRPLLGMGLGGIAICMLILSYGFGSASYTLTPNAIDSLPLSIDREELAPLSGVTFHSDVEFRQAVVVAAGPDVFKQYESQFVSAAIAINPAIILFGILGFVASFAISLGPVMWVLFSELFPNQLRGLAISFAGLINSGVSFGVQLLFPVELEALGNSMTFLIYGLFAIAGFVFIMRTLPETKGRSLEELEHLLVRN